MNARYYKQVDPYADNEIEIVFQVPDCPRCGTRGQIYSTTPRTVICQKCGAVFIECSDRETENQSAGLKPAPPDLASGLKSRLDLLMETRDNFYKGSFYEAEQVKAILYLFSELSMLIRELDEMRRGKKP